MKRLEEIEHRILAYRTAAHGFPLDKARHAIEYDAPIVIEDLCTVVKLQREALKAISAVDGTTEVERTLIACCKRAVEAADKILGGE